MYLLGGASVPVMIFRFLIVFLVITFSSCGKPSYDMENPPVPSYGEGSIEVIIFTDYFCPPCQKLETELDPMMIKLLEKGDVKIIFVDAPVNKHTQLYAKYFMYSINARADFQGILKTRRTLFAAARTNAVFTEEDIASELRAQGIAFQPYDLRKVYTALNELMKYHDIRSTPTCVVKYSDSDIRKYMGPDDIKRGLLLLLSEQRHVK
jgi:thiol-disulfide isomerase/thioredoxin